MEMKIPWEWTWEKYPEKSRKVEIKMQAASDFFPLVVKFGSGIRSLVSARMLEKSWSEKSRKYRDLFRRILFHEWVGNVGAGLVRPVRTCWDRFGPIFMGKMHIKISMGFWVVHVFKMALYRVAGYRRIEKVTAWVKSKKSNTLPGRWVLLDIDGLKKHFLGETIKYVTPP